MIKKSRCRTRDVSICLILTIIILISISGGCTSIRPPTIEGKDAREVGLLITKYPYEGTIHDNDVFIFRIDGIPISSDPNKIGKINLALAEGSVWAEVLPGLHDVHLMQTVDDVHLTYENKRIPTGLTSTKFFTTVKVDIKPHEVKEIRTKISVSPYALYEYCLPNTKTNTTLQVIEVQSLKNYYDGETGIATHPTDSQLSFKVK